MDEHKKFNEVKNTDDIVGIFDMKLGKTSSIGVISNQMKDFNTFIGKWVDDYPL
ncbi:MAG: hypothetical protein LBB73_06545 [Dysgonamonadaceae bacterium]|nr:hypothetical protein [Dysgonamonadaceae bacterium]